MTIINNKIILPELATDPATPDSAERTLYAKADGLYTRDSAGDVVPLERKYKVYTALLNQEGTNNPVATVLENTFGAIVWSRDNTGRYFGTPATPLPESNNIVFSVFHSNWAAGVYIDYSIDASNPEAVTFYIAVSDPSYSDGYLQKTPIEIRVY